MNGHCTFKYCCPCIVEAEVWPATGLILRENSLEHFSGLVLVNAISENVLTGSDQFVVKENLMC